MDALAHFLHDYFAPMYIGATAHLRPCAISGEARISRTVPAARYNRVVGRIHRPVLQERRI